MKAVGLWVDPVCPWAWATARWLIEVERVRDIVVCVNVMSLSVLNSGRENVSDFYRDQVPRWWGPVRVLIAAAKQHGDEVRRPLYLAMGRRIHNDQRGSEDLPAVIAEALTELELPMELGESAVTDEFDGLLRESHQAGMGPVGEEVGTPVIHIPADAGTTVAFFGPVLKSVPKGEEAGRLWDGVMAVTGWPGFTELKRSRSGLPNPN